MLTKTIICYIRPMKNFSRPLVVLMIFFATVSWTETTTCNHKLNTEISNNFEFEDCFSIVSMEYTHTEEAKTVKSDYLDKQFGTEIGNDYLNFDSLAVVTLSGTRNDLFYLLFKPDIILYGYSKQYLFGSHSHSYCYFRPGAS